MDVLAFYIFCDSINFIDYDMLAFKSVKQILQLPNRAKAKKKRRKKRWSHIAMQWNI